MIGLIENENGDKFSAMLKPEIVIVGEATTEKTKHKYKRVMMHYYDRWYDYAAKMRKMYEKTQAVKEGLFNLNSYDAIPIKKKKTSDDDCNLPEENDDILPPGVTVFVKQNDYKKSMLLNIYKNFSRSTEKENYTQFNLTNYKKVESQIKNVMNFHLFILIHGFNINHEVRKTCKNISKEFPCDFVEIFENKIYIHSSGTTDDDLFGDLIQKEIKPKIQKKKIYEAFMVDGTPKLKLVHYKKVY